MKKNWTKSNKFYFVASLVVLSIFWLLPMIIVSLSGIADVSFSEIIPDNLKWVILVGIVAIIMLNFAIFIIAFSRWGMQLDTANNVIKIGEMLQKIIENEPKIESRNISTENEEDDDSEYEEVDEKYKIMSQGAKWACKNCCELNPAYNTTCQACGAPKNARAETKNCPHCGMANSIDAVYCSRCRKTLDVPAPVKPNTFCSVCGEENPTGAKFCGRCGKQL